MTVNPYDVDAAARYDKALRLSQKRYPPPAGIISPKPTKYWPEENITLFREYQRWLLDGGASHNCTFNISIPTAGHVLGLSLKSHEALCLEQDIERALSYIEAREMSAVWTTNCRRALDRFRRYLELKRGEITFSPYPRFDLDRYTVGLPTWLIKHLDQIRIVRQGSWRKARRHEALIIFWWTHTQLVNAGCPITTIQRLMGHRRLTSTLVYARVHDRTVAEDYFTAMAAIEGSMADDEDETKNETPLDWLAKLVAEKMTAEQEDALTKLSAHLVEKAAQEKKSSQKTDKPPPQRGGK